MQFQAQKLVSRNATMEMAASTLTQREADDLDLFVGVTTAISSPYNLFLRVSDVEANSTMIYFYAYSLGRERVILWGVYDAINNEFLVDNNCLYDISDLADIIKIWQSHAYKFSLSSQKNSMTMRLKQGSIYNDVKQQRDLSTSFRSIFYANLVFDGLLNLDQVRFLVQASDPKINKNAVLQNEVNRLIDEDADIQWTYYDHLRLAAQSGSTVLWRISARDDDFTAYINLIDTMLKYIHTEDDRAVIRATINHPIRLANYGILPTPTRLQAKLAELILATVYIITFSEFEEYKAAKLLVYLYDESKGMTKQKQEIPMYLKGTFLYEWLLHVAGIFKVYDVEDFIFEMASVFVLFHENKINNSSGVIGLGGMGKNFGNGANFQNRLETMSSFFQDFIAKSIYSKSSYIRGFQSCPMIKPCQTKECELIYHGVGNHQSRHDLT